MPEYPLKTCAGYRPLLKGAMGMAADLPAARRQPRAVGGFAYKED